MSAGSPGPFYPQAESKSHSDIQTGFLSAVAGRTGYFLLGVCLQGTANSLCDSEKALGGLGLFYTFPHGKAVSPKDGHEPHHQGLGKEGASHLSETSISPKGKLRQLAPISLGQECPHTSGPSQLSAPLATKTHTHIGH